MVFYPAFISDYVSLLQAIAGEAGVPFFYRAGSEFEEMYVISSTYLNKLVLSLCSYRGFFPFHFLYDCHIALRLVILFI